MLNKQPEKTYIYYNQSVFSSLISDIITFGFFFVIIATSALFTKYFGMQTLWTLFFMALLIIIIIAKVIDKNSKNVFQTHNLDEFIEKARKDMEEE